MDGLTEATSLKWHKIQWVMLQRTNATKNSSCQDATKKTDATTNAEE